MAEITASDLDAVKSLLATKFKVTDAQYQIDYAKIAIFLSDEKNFFTHFKDVSNLLRVKYNAIVANKDDKLSNVFTRAIFELAKDYGFSTQTNVVFAGFISPTDITKDYIKQGILWKDDVGSQHGEYSHSLQWLTIGQSGIIGKDRVLELYKNSVDYQSEVKFDRPDGTMKPYLWDFLVDCFYYGGTPDFKTNIITNTVRSPAYFNKMLFTKWKATWVGAIIADRYTRKNFQIPTLTATSGEKNLTQIAINAHRDKKDYTEKASGSGFIYSRDINHRTVRNRTVRGLAVKTGKIDSQEIIEGKKYPKTIKSDESPAKIYTVPAHERLTTGKAENIVGSKVSFEDWGGQAGGITF